MLPRGRWGVQVVSCSWLLCILIYICIDNYTYVYMLTLSNVVSSVILPAAESKLCFRILAGP